MEELPESVRNHLLAMGVAFPLSPVEGGKKAWVTLGNEDWILQRRGMDSRETLEIVSAWTKEHRANSDVLSGTEMTVVGEDDHSYWALTPRLNTSDLAEAYRGQPTWDAFRAAWPYMIETMRVLEELQETSTPIASLASLPNNTGNAVRIAPIALKASLLLSDGIDLRKVRGAPESAPLGRIRIYHGDLTYRNMVQTKPGDYRAVDWEMVSASPVAVELSHSLACHLIWEPDPSRWEEMIEFALPAMVAFSDLTRDEMLSSLFWGVVADAFVCRELVEVSYRQGDFLLGGLQVIADLIG